MPLVSIIMPAFNAAEYIEASIQSVIAQTYKQWELIVINDGSTDQTSNIVQNLIKTDSRITYIYQRNQRLGAARNTGIKAAKGEWIGFLDSDDLWMPTKLEKQLALSKDLPEVDVIFTAGWIFNGNDLNNLISYPIKTGRFSPKEMYILEYESNYIPVLSVLVKKSVIDNTGLQEERIFFYGCEDWDYWLRMARAGAVFYGMSVPLFCYRRHDNNMSNNSIVMQLSQAASFIKNYEADFFSNKQAQEIFKPLIRPLLLNLLIKGRINDCFYLLHELNQILPSLYNSVAILLIRIFRKKSIPYLKVINNVL